MFELEHILALRPLFQMNKIFPVSWEAHIDLVIVTRNISKSCAYDNVLIDSSLQIENRILT